MSAADCEAYVRGIVGNKLTDNELEKAFEKYDELRRQFVKMGKTDNIDKRIAAAIANEAKMRKFNKAKVRKNAILDVTRRRVLHTFIDQMRAAGYGPADAIKVRTGAAGFLSGAQSNVEGVRDNHDNKRNTYYRKWVGGFLAEIVEKIPTALKLLQDHRFDEQVGQEIGEIRRTGGAPGVTGNKDALTIAQAQHEWEERARLEYNAQGGMKPLPSAWHDISHDPYRMLDLKNGGGKVGWVDFLYDRIDVEQTFPGIDPSNVDEIKSAMMRDYDMKITGRYYPDASAPVPKRAPSSLIDRFSIDGQYVFKSFEAQKEYQQKFGHGTFMSSAIHSWIQMARATAGLEIFGPNPEVTIKQLSSEYVTKLHEEMRNITDPKELAKYHKWVADLQGDKMRGHIEEMVGTAAIPTNVSVAKMSAGVRSVLSMGKLSNLVVSSTIGDSMNMIGNATYGGQHGLDALRPVTRMFDGMDPHTRKITALRFGEGLQGFIGSIYANTIETGPLGGGLAKTMDLFFKVIGVTGMFDHSRQAFVRERSTWLAQQRHLDFASLDPFLQKGLTRNGINALKWDAIRSAPIELINGENYIMPESARSAEDKYILLIASERIKEAYQISKADEAKLEMTKKKRIKMFERRRDLIIKQTRYDLEMQLRQYYMDETNYAVVQPNAYSRRISRGAVFGAEGTKPGSMIGEVVRSMFMYKNFSIVNWDNLARAIENKNVTQMGVAGAGVLARLIAFQVVAGYLIEYMKDIAKGNWPPRAPWSGEMMMRAYSSGGSMGIYGDYITGIINGYDTPAAILGPEADYAIKVLKFAGHDIWTRKTGKAAGAVQLGLDVTPFGNAFVVRPVIDYTILDELREWSSPGYKKRRRNKLKKKGQYNIYEEAFR